MYRGIHRWIVRELLIVKNKAPRFITQHSEDSEDLGRINYRKAWIRPGTIFDQFFPGFWHHFSCEVLTALVIPRLRTAAALGGIFDAESCDAWRTWEAY